MLVVTALVPTRCQRDSQFGACVNVPCFQVQHEKTELNSHLEILRWEGMLKYMVTSRCVLIWKSSTKMSSREQHGVSLNIRNHGGPVVLDLAQLHNHHGEAIGMLERSPQLGMPEVRSLKGANLQLVMSLAIEINVEQANRLDAPSLAGSWAEEMGCTLSFPVKSKQNPG